MIRRSTTSNRLRIVAILLMFAAFLAVDSRTASAQCETWTLTVAPDVALCAFPLIVETAWGPAGVRSPDAASGFLGVFAPGTSFTFPVPPDPNRPFVHAYITNAIDPVDIIEDITVAIGETKTVLIGCCCCVEVQVVQDPSQCITVNINSKRPCGI